MVGPADPASIRDVDICDEAFFAFADESALAAVVPELAGEVRCTPLRSISLTAAFAALV
jgi:hypothetical protein